MGAIIRPQGYLTIVEPGKQTIECDTFTCQHCNALKRVRVGQVNQAPFCLKCMSRICQRCHDVAAQTGECTPFEKKLDEFERGIRRSLAG